jgi:hypothetical protein
VVAAVDPVATTLAEDVVGAFLAVEHFIPRLCEKAKNRLPR